VLEKMEKKYGIKLPRKVITIDYGDDVGDLFIRFKHAETTMENQQKTGKQSYTTMKKEK
jgi:hypothetical protein